MRSTKNQLLRFLIYGGLAACANFGSRFIFSIWLPFGYAVVLSFFVGLSVGFLLMRGYVFTANKDHIFEQGIKYLAVNLVALALTLGVSLFCATYFLPLIGAKDHAEAIGHGIGVIAPMITSYFGHRWFTFR